jgi:hypothetical protein
MLNSGKLLHWYPDLTEATCLFVTWLPDYIKISLCRLAGAILCSGRLSAASHSGGAIVTNLNRVDFHVEEDGIPQIIKYFSRESDLPLTIGLLVDTSRSQRSVLEPERRASHTFLDRMLRGDKDRAFVAHFDIRVEVLQDLTSSRTKLASALAAQSVHISWTLSAPLDAVNPGIDGIARAGHLRRA